VDALLRLPVDGIAYYIFPPAQTSNQRQSVYYTAPGGPVPPLVWAAFHPTGGQLN